MPAPLLAKCCRFCGVGAAACFGNASNSCSACDRQRLRVGLTPCCARLPVDPQFRYCPGCDGDGARVPVVLVSPEGRERISYHPITARVGGRAGLMLGELAQALGVPPEALVLDIADDRSWHLDRLVVRPGSLPTPVKFTCTTCHQPATRWVRPGSRPRTCGACRAKVRRAAQARYTARLAAAAPDCPACGRTGVRRLVVFSPTGQAVCDACHARARRQGTCRACESPMQRRRGRTWCPECDPAPLRRGSVTVTVTDGTRTERVQSSDKRLTAWLGPLLFVPFLPRRGARVPLHRSAVIGGLHLPGTGPSSRLAMRAISEAPGVPVAQALVEAGFTLAEAGNAVRHLTTAGLLADDQLTDRARSVMAWARSAGVRL